MMWILFLTDLCHHLTTCRRRTIHFVYKKSKEWMNINRFAIESERIIVAWNPHCQDDSASAFIWNNFFPMNVGSHSSDRAVFFLWLGLAIVAYGSEYSGGQHQDQQFQITIYSPTTRIPAPIYLSLTVVSYIWRSIRREELDSRSSAGCISAL